MTFRKWWRETRGRYVIALVFIVWNIWQAPVVRAPDGPCQPKLYRRTTSEYLRDIDRMAAAPGAQPLPAEIRTQVEKMRELLPVCGGDGSILTDWRSFANRQWDDWFESTWATQFTPTLALLAVMLAAGGPMTEGRSGTAPLALSLPLPRRRIIWRRWWHSFGAAAVLAAAALALAIARSSLTAAPSLPSHAILYLLPTLLLMGAAISITLLASVLTRDIFVSALVAGLSTAVCLSADWVFFDRAYFGFLFVVHGPEGLAIAASMLIGFMLLAILRYEQQDY